MSSAKSSPSPPAAVVDEHRVGSDAPFYVIMGVIGGVYVVLLLGLLVADVSYMVDLRFGRRGRTESWVGVVAAGIAARAADSRNVAAAADSILHQTHTRLLPVYCPVVADRGRAHRLFVVAVSVSRTQISWMPSSISRSCCRRWWWG